MTLGSISVSISVLGILTSVAMPSYGQTWTNSHTGKTILYINAIHPSSYKDSPPKEFGGRTAYIDAANAVFGAAYSRSQLPAKGWLLRARLNTTSSDFDSLVDSPTIGKVAIVLFAHHGLDYKGEGFDWAKSLTALNVLGETEVVGAFLGYCRSARDAIYLNGKLPNSVNIGFPGSVYPSDRLLNYAHSVGEMDDQGMHSAEQELPKYFSQIANTK
jgi:hypothetical protein